MKRITGSLLAALVPFVGVAAVTTAPSIASAAQATAPPTTGTPSWASLEQTALQTTAGARGDGTLNLAGLPSVPVQSTITTPSGPVSLAQETVVGTDRSGTVVVDMALLGGRQLIVSEVSPAENYQGETLVLQPGTSSVSGVYHLAGARPATASASALRTTGHRSRGIAATTGVFNATGAGAEAQLAAAGGCFEAPQNPGVIGSVFGLLIQGEGVIECTSSAETLAIIAAIYQNNGTQLGNAGGSGWGAYLGINSYAPCYTTGYHYFQTAELWAVNGVGQAGGDSGWAYLDCT